MVRLARVRTGPAPRQLTTFGPQAYRVCHRFRVRDVLRLGVASHQRLKADKGSRTPRDEGMMSLSMNTSLWNEIQVAAGRIPDDLMMTVGSEEARRLAIRYRSSGVSDLQILSAIVTAVSARRQWP